MPRPQQHDPIQARHDANAVGPLGVGGEGGEQESNREGVSWQAGAGRGMETAGAALGPFWRNPLPGLLKQDARRWATREMLPSKKTKRERANTAADGRHRLGSDARAHHEALPHERNGAREAAEAVYGLLKTSTILMGSPRVRSSSTAAVVQVEQQQQRQQQQQQRGN